MSAARFVHRLAALGIELRTENGRLRYRAEPGSLTDNLREDIARQRPAIMAALDAIAGTLANVQAEPEAAREAWRREIVAMLRWEETGNAPDANLMLDLVALRRIAPFGTCLDCGGATARDGRHWCTECERASIANTKEIA